MRKSKKHKVVTLADLFDKPATKKVGLKAIARKQKAKAHSERTRSRVNREPLTEEQQAVNRMLSHIMQRDTEARRAFKLFVRGDHAQSCYLISIVKMLQRWNVRYRYLLKWPTFGIGHPLYWTCTNATYRKLSRR
jgi:hypothetical protein